MREYGSTLANVGYEFAKLPPALVTRLQGPELLTTMSRLDAYVKRAC